MNEERESVNEEKTELTGQKDLAKGWYPAAAPNRNELSGWYSEPSQAPGRLCQRRLPLPGRQSLRLPGCEAIYTHISDTGGTSFPGSPGSHTPSP